MVRRSPRSTTGRGLPRVLLVLALALSACTAGTSDPSPAPVADPLLEIAEREGTVVVIVQLAVPQGAAGSADPVTLIGRARRKLMSELGPGARVVERFGGRLPQVMLRVDAEALQQLRQSDLVVTISLNTADEPTE